MRDIFPIDLPYNHLIHVWQDLTVEAGEVCGERFYILEAKPEHCYKMNIRQEQRETFDPEDWDRIYRMSAWLKILTPMNYSLFHGNKLMLMVSIIPVAELVGEVTFLTDQNLVDAHPRVKGALMRMFNKALDSLPFPRIQAKVDNTFEIGKKFVERLGFEKEGLMRKFGPSQHDYVLYGLIKE